MTNKMGNATNKKIIELLQDYRSGLLILKPKFQRNLVWNNAHKAKFIQTIFDQMPFPEIYLSDGEIDLTNQKTTIWVVDGQQRLSTIFNYIDALIDLSKFDIKPFEQLEDDSKKLFFSYIVVIRQLGKLSEEEIKEIFKRINSVNYALNAVEISNALYEGEFISIGKAIASSSDFQALEVLSEPELARMKDLEYVLIILASVELGHYFTQTSDLEEVVQRFNDEYPNATLLKQSTQQALTLIHSLKLPFDSLWFRKSSMFSLLTEIIKHYFYTPSATIDHSKLLSELINAEEVISISKSEDPDSNIYAKFYKHMFQQTTSKTGRDARGLVVSEILKRC